MGQFYTGAVVTKTATGYAVVFQDQLVAEFAFKDLAIMLALNSAKLATLVQSNNVYLLKAA